MMKDKSHHSDLFNNADTEDTDLQFWNMGIHFHQQLSTQAPISHETNYFYKNI